MSEIGSTFLTVLPSMKGFDRSVSNQVDRTGRTAGNRFGTVFASAGIKPFRAFGAAALGFFAVDKIASFFGDSIAEARESQKVGAQTAAVIKSTGGAANVSAKQFGTLANSISRYSGIDDEAIQAGENLLATFTNVKNLGPGKNIFSRATKLATDMGVALGTDTKTAALQLGKALNDPAKGFSRLQRSGVSFTDTQIAQIKNFQKTGQLAKAQGVILGEVSKEFGGSAAAQATAGEKAKVAYDNLKEAVGTALLPVLDRTFNAITPIVTSLTNNLPSAINTATGYIKRLFSSFSGSAGGGQLASVFTSVVGAVRTNFLPAVQALATTFTTRILPAVAAVGAYFATNLLPIFTRVGQLISTYVIPIIGSMATFFATRVYPAVVEIAGAVATKLKPVFDQFFVTIQTTILPAVQRLLAKFQQYQPQIQMIISAVVRVIGALAVFGATVLGKVLPPLIRFSGFLAGRLIGAIGLAIGLIVRIASNAIIMGTAFVRAVRGVSSFVAAVVSKIAAVVRAVASIPGKIRSAVGSGLKVLVRFGGDIVQGLVNGIRGAAGRVLAAVHALVDKIPAVIRHKMGISSPSKVTTGFGQNIGDGLANGMLNRVGAVTSAADKVGEAAKKKLKEKLQKIKDEISTLSGSIASNFTSDLFSSSDGGPLTGSGFIKNLTSTQGNLTGLLAAFKTLKSFGLPASFLSQLFSQGGAPLILELASNKGEAQTASSLFGSVTSLSNQLGNQVATNQYGKGAKGTNDRIDETNRLLRRQNELLRGVERAAAGSGTRAAANARRRAQRGQIRAA